MALNVKAFKELPGTRELTGKDAKLLGAAFSGHHYRHEDLMKPKVVEDLGKLEDVMAQEDKPYWEAQELREAMSISEDDSDGRKYVNSLLSYLRDENRVTTGGPNALGSYILTRRADEIAQRDFWDFGKHNRIGGRVVPQKGLHIQR